ncbi:MAG: phytanoyl-CoA dioxygenase family protein [Armatimonadota bacterium]|nr:phytanoyl-CoA dioxygenase family protein [Armatimonadota bacterium]
MPTLTEPILDRPAATNVQLQASVHGLTEAQKAQFERDGFLVLRGLFSPEEAAAIRDAFMAQNADGPVPGLSSIGESVVDPADPLAFYARMMNPHSQPEREVGQIARNFLLDPRLEPALTDLFGEAPVGVQTMFYFKPPGARGQALHQDNFYLRVKPGTCMAAWLAVDDVDAENGGMKVVPGSHREDVACPQKADPDVSFTTEYVPAPEGMEAVHCDMKAGDVLFFNGSLIHGSTPNTSPTRFRCSLIAHYVPRYSQELSEWYRSPLTFDGQVVEIAKATGGGPCGTPQRVAGPH